MAITVQEYYDLLVTTSANSGFPSIRAEDDGRNYCRYRNSDGKKCAFGVLIPDDKYNPDMECGQVGEILKRYMFLNEYIPSGMNINDLQNIQYIHDDLATSLKQEWSHGLFVARLNKERCFDNCTKVAN